MSTERTTERDRLPLYGLPYTLGDPSDGDSGETTPPASDGDQTGDGAGASEDGGGAGGSQVDTDASVADRERLMQTIRDLQSQRDRAEARLRQVTESSRDDSGSTGMTPEQIRAEMIRATEIANLAVQLRTSEEFKLADPGIYARAAEFDSPEALRVAVEASHREMQVRLDSLGVVPKTDAEAELARYREAFGELNESPPSGDGGAATGDPTLEQLKSMPLDEYLQVPQEVVDRVMRSVYS